MNLEKITKDNFNEFYGLMENDFPESERRTKHDQMKLLDNSKASLNFIIKDGQVAGYFVFWDFGDFAFIEHIATKKELRGQGVGTIFLEGFIKEINKQIILEVDPPIDEVSIKRIKFYEHLGFVLNDFDYTQPSYHKNGVGVDMKIMSLNKPLTKSEFDYYIREIYKNVYSK